MTTPLLSILIPTVVGREESFNKLVAKIMGSYKWEETKTVATDWAWGVKWCLDIPIEIYFYYDDKILTIGEKREKLYMAAQGTHSIQVDDDDELAPNAIELILQAIKSNPEVDCITFEEYCNMDGREYKSNHSLTYSTWYGDGSRLLHDGFHYHRCPYFKSVIKTSIAQSVPVPKVRYAEDVQWSEELFHHLHTEIHISEPLYRYIHISSPFNERYGISES